MPVDLSKLEQGFGDPLDSLLSACKGRWVEMRPYFAIRSPFEQAKLWRQSHMRGKNEQEIAWLLSQREPFLARCLESVGPRDGRQVTKPFPVISGTSVGRRSNKYYR